MSLIHQALKKIEFRRPGYSGVDLRRPAGGVQRTEIRVLAGGLLVMLIGLAILAAYTYRLFDLRTEPIEAELDALKSSVSAPPVRPGELASDHNQKGIGLFEEGRLNEARAEFEAALTFDPENAVNLNNAGLAAFAMGDLETAEGYFRAALALRPDYPEAFNNYGGVFEARGDLKKALEHYSQAVRSSPSYADAQLNMAIACEKMGDYREALEHYEAYLGLTGPGAGEVRKKAARIKSFLTTVKKG